MKYSIIIPVYRNEESIPRLIDALTGICRDLDEPAEVVFVVDGSPDGSYALLNKAIDSLDFPAQLLAHSRNFGSYPAIRSGLGAARGQFLGVMAADLQEPPELMTAFLTALAADECDVAVGTRTGRNDPFFTRLSSGIFWRLYRKFVVREMPTGGVDVFGCNRMFRDQLLRLEESRSSLIALIFWMGFRRKLVGYERQERQEGRSSWTLSKRIDYMMDSVFAFTDLPIRLVTRIGLMGSLGAAALGVSVATAKLSGLIEVPGYAATMLVVLFLGALNLLALGLVGTYAWRTYENTKRRPTAIVAMARTNRKDHP
ncbi:MAG: glycosyltransferase family 2 protein [Burkholderiales bacterium]|nr:glycosyltransferase family 2 protein [Burkholderiales bacterium]